MATATAEQFNITSTTFSIMPLAFTGKPYEKGRNPFTPSAGQKPLTRAQLDVLSYISTCSKSYGAGNRLTYADICAELQLSSATLRKALEVLAQRGFIEKLGKSRYRLAQKARGGDYIIIDSYLHKTKWRIEGKLKRLTRSAVLVLELLIRHYLNPHNGGKLFISSQNRIAKALGLSPSTVADALLELMHARLVYRKLFADGRAVPGKGKNGYELSAYEVKSELLRVKRKKSELAEVKQLFNPTTSAPSEAEIEERADELDDKLRAAPEYEKLRQKVLANRSEVVAAIRADDEPREKQLNDEYEELQNTMERYLAAHNIRPKALAPSWFGRKLWEGKYKN